MNTVEIEKTIYTTTGNLYMTIPIEFSDTGKINNILTIYKCREQVINAFARAFHMKNKQIGKLLKKTLTKNARVILFGIPNEIIEKIKDVLKPLHIIENAIGMPNTIPIKVLDIPSKHVSSIMFKGSSKWFRSSHTISLWLLLLRVCFRNNPTFVGNNLEELHEVANKFKGGCSTNGEYWNLEDESHIHDTIHTWVPLMKNLNRIFSPNVRWKDRYTANKAHVSNKGCYLASFSSEGILKLAKRKSQHKNADKLLTFL